MKNGEVKMKVALGTDDKKTLRKGHFGHSRYFAIIEILNGEIVANEIRKNPHVDSGEGHNSHGEPEKIRALLEDCGLFMAKRMGRRSAISLSTGGVDCIITDIDSVDQAVSTYLYKKSDQFKYFSKVADDFVPCSQRSIM